MTKTTALSSRDCNGNVLTLGTSVISACLGFRYQCLGFLKPGLVIWLLIITSRHLVPQIPNL